MASIYFIPQDKLESFFPDLTDFKLNSLYEKQEIQSEKKLDVHIEQINEVGRIILQAIY